MDVSVPFRGSCSEMAIVEALSTGVSFPSPFGVRVLKFSILSSTERNLPIVSVPFRGSCSEIFFINGGNLGVPKFPSPFGVRVLKSGVEWFSISSFPCFRPLSGFVF